MSGQAYGNCPDHTRFGTKAMGRPHNPDLLRANVAGAETVRNRPPGLTGCLALFLIGVPSPTLIGSRIAGVESPPRRRPSDRLGQTCLEYEVERGLCYLGETSETGAADDVLDGCRPGLCA